jgi:DNA gyrase/topoisomerase IV subunit B
MGVGGGEEAMNAENPLAGVRLRPAMYIGALGDWGLERLTGELLDNSVEQALLGLVDVIEVVRHADGSFSVSDDGPGIPVAADEDGIPVLTRFFTRLNLGHRLTREPRFADPGGIGLGCLNALSTCLDVTVHRDGGAWRQSFGRGEVLSPLTHEAGVAGKGTSIRVLPDAEFFDGVEYPARHVTNRLRTLSFLVPGLRLVWTDEVRAEWAEFHHFGGLGDFVELLNTGRRARHPPIVISQRRSSLHVHAAIQYNDAASTQILSFVNHYNTRRGGTHEEGLRRGIVRALNRQKPEQRESLEWRGRLQFKHVGEGLTAVISVRLPRPCLAGCTRQRLEGEGIAAPVAAAVTRGIERFLQDHPGAWDRIAWERRLTARYGVSGC